MRRLWTVGLVTLALLAPCAAQACTVTINAERLSDDPREFGISAREKSRREAALRADLAQGLRAEAKRLRTEARSGLANGSEAHALALVESLVPDPLRVSRAPCATAPSIDSEDPHYRTTQAALLAVAGGSAQFWREQFAEGYAALVGGCGAEMRGRLAGYVVANFDAAKLARVWSEVHRLGFDRSGTANWLPLHYRYGGPEVGLVLRESADVNGHGWDGNAHSLETEAFRRVNASNWARMSRFLTGDDDARELVAVLEAGLVELGDPTLPYAGLCPQTTAPLAEFVANAIENAKPLKPRVEVVFDQPDAAGS